MKFICPINDQNLCSDGSKIVRDGKFFRPSDGREIQRFRCKTCGKRFSSATFDPAYRQNKRRVNFQLRRLLSSTVSLRRCALILSVARKTVERKLVFLGRVSKLENENYLKTLDKITYFQFDDLQTIEHSKCKPLSVTLAVEAKKRKLLGFEVSQMPATGHLAEISRKKYGYRKDMRMIGIKKLLQKVKPLSISEVTILSDEHPFYPPIVRQIFPYATHETTKGARGCISGQGELKKLKYDPLFSLNHTCGMLRANINRLIRKTWCTTKDPKRLTDHLNIYMHFHNTVLTE